tara:strand:+ start:47 stop:202 length:156 start_codon:yes stop_codon:yes gene_type:complete
LPTKELGSSSFLFADDYSLPLKIFVIDFLEPLVDFRLIGVSKGRETNEFVF